MKIKVPKLVCCVKREMHGGITEKAGKGQAPPLSGRAGMVTWGVSCPDRTLKNWVQMPGS